MLLSVFKFTLLVVMGKLLVKPEIEFGKFFKSFQHVTFFSFFG